MNLESLTGTLKSIVILARDREISFLAGGIAFFAFLSLIPLMILVVTLGSLIGGEGFATRLLGIVDQYLSEEGSEILATALADSSGLAGITAVSGLFLLWSALKVFRAVDIAFDRVYQLEVSTSILEQIRNGIVVLAAIAAGGAILLFFQLVLARLAVGPLSLLFGRLLLLGGLVVVLLPVYYVLPPIKQQFRGTLPGTVVAMVGLVFLSQTFELYASQAGQYQAYGVVGAVLLFLLWLYFGALIVVFGAVVNAAIADDGDDNDDTPKTVTEREGAGPLEDQSDVQHEDDESKPNATD